MGVELKSFYCTVFFKIGGDLFLIMLCKTATYNSDLSTLDAVVTKQCLVDNQLLPPQIVMLAVGRWFLLMFSVFREDSTGSFVPISPKRRVTLWSILFPKDAERKLQETCCMAKQQKFLCMCGTLLWAGWFILRKVRTASSYLCCLNFPFPCMLMCDTWLPRVCVITRVLLLKYTSAFLLFPCPLLKTRTVQ